jgi:hypothetical protein
MFTIEQIQKMVEKNLGIKSEEYENLESLAFEYLLDEGDITWLGLSDDAVKEGIPETFDVFVSPIYLKKYEGTGEEHTFYIFFTREGEEENEKYVPFALNLVNEDGAVLKYSVIL